MLSEADRRVVNALLGGFPLVERPFAHVAAGLGLSEDELIAAVTRLREDGMLTRFGPMYDAVALGGAFSLCAMAVPEERFAEVAALVNDLPEVAHNYRREHAFNMWFVLATERPQEIAATIARIEAATGLTILNLPKLEEYFLELKLEA
jgi:DNA-binding Lrp family transcriptional regulator